MAHKMQRSPEPRREITAEAVLADIRGGIVSIWQLGAAFDVPSYLPLLHDTVAGLIASKQVIQSGQGLYTARLTPAPEAVDPPPAGTD